MTKEQELIVNGASYRLLIYNQIPVMIAAEFKDMIKKYPKIYCKKTKLRLNHLFELLEKYDWKSTHDIINRDCLLYITEIHDAIEEKLAEDMLKFENAMYLEYSKRGVKHARLMAKWTLLGTYINYCVTVWNMLMDMMQSYFPRARKVFVHYNIEHCLKAWGECYELVIDSLGIKDEDLVDFSTSQMCITGFDIIDHKLHSCEFLKNAIDEAYEQAEITKQII